MLWFTPTLASCARCLFCTKAERYMAKPPSGFDGNIKYRWTLERSRKEMSQRSFLWDKTIAQMRGLFCTEYCCDFPNLPTSNPNLTSICLDVFCPEIWVEYVKWKLFIFSGKFTSMPRLDVLDPVFLVCVSTSNHGELQHRNTPRINSQNSPEDEIGFLRNTSRNVCVLIYPRVRAFQ